MTEQATKGTEEILVKQYRGTLWEDTHRGHVVVVDENKKVIYQVGNPDHYTYLRSASKPIQLLPFLDLELDKKYGITPEELVILAGSHMGAPFQVAAVESIAKKMDIQEESLILQPCYPFYEENRIAVIQQGKAPRKFFHGCSGKHLAAMALARELGGEEDEYYRPETPAQQLILEYIAALSNYPKSNITIGLDGCGVPVFAVPLSHMAGAALTMAHPELLESPPHSSTQQSAQRIVAVYHQHCDYITNPGLLCTELNRDPNIFAKGGSQGIYAFALKNEKIGVSFKISDGSEETWNLVAASILEQLGYKNQATMKAIRALRPPELVNASGMVCGRYDTVFTL